MLIDDPACFRLDRVPVRPIHWLWRPYLACGKLALLDGDPGAGKSLLTADLAARLTRGGRMPDGTWRRRKANVLFLNAEDALDDTLRPRLDAAGADHTLVVRRVSTRRARRRLLPSGQKRESEGASP
jgi:hypothetical protein